jgi:hypothetical protein
MQRLATLTTTIGTITAIACMAPVAAQAAPSTESPSSAESSKPATNIVAPNLPANLPIAAPSAIALPESTSPIESATTIVQVPAPTAPTAQVWTIETTPVQPLPGQTADGTATATQPVWTETSTTPNANVATAELPLTPEITPIAPIPIDPATGEVTAQLSPESDSATFLREIESFEPPPKPLVRRKASPGLTLGVPSGFGADRGRTFVGLGLYRTRINSNDGSAGIGIGLGNARKGLGVQISYTSFSISPGKLFPSLSGIAASPRPFGSGGFNVKIHHQFPGALSVAIGADSIVNIGPRISSGVSGGTASDGTFQNELEGTYYVAATKLFQLKPDASDSFSRLAVTVGAGTGRFQPTRTLIEGRTIVTPFASVALKISPAASVIAEWGGQDFGVGLSWVPFRNLPIVLTPAIRDIFGPDATKPRFVMGFGLSL